MTNVNLKSTIFRLIASDQLIANLPGHVYWKDSSGAFLGCNLEQAYTFRITDPNDIVGKTNFDFFDDKTARRLNALDRQVIKENRTIEEIEIVGESEYFLSKKTPLKNQDGETIGILGTSINITKQKQLESELQQKTQELAVAIEIRDKVLNIVSHEMKNTLQGMFGISEELLIAWDRIKEEEKKSYLQDVLNARERLILFLSDLLEVAKLRSGILKFNFAEFSILELVKKALSEFNRSSTVVTLQPKEDLPETGYGDYSRIQQVLDNLLRNAVKYGGQNHQVEVSITSSNKFSGFIEIAVRDQGIGVPIDEVELVFESFYEGTRTRRKEGGTGLGLSICKEIINAHAGTIWLEPNHPQGSAFIFTIPKSADIHRQQLAINKKQESQLQG